MTRVRRVLYIARMLTATGHTRKYKKDSVKGGKIISNGRIHEDHASISIMRIIKYQKTRNSKKKSIVSKIKR